MDKFYKRNIPYKLVSFLLAVLIWVYVTNELNPSDNIVTQVPLEPVGIRSALAIREIPATIKVRLQGKRNVISTATNKEVRAFVNLAKAEKGENIIDVDVVVPSGFQVVEKTPAKVKVILDELQEQQIPVRAQINGKPMPGYKAESPLFEPTQVMVKGPEKLVEKIKFAEIAIDIQGQNKTASQSIPVLLYGNEGQRIEGFVKIDPVNIDITIPIFREKEVKLVQIQPKLVGKPAEGFQIASVIVEPKDIFLQGNADALARINNIATGEINVAGANIDMAQEVPLELPAGINTSKVKKARVFIQVVPQLVEKTFYPVPVVMENIPQGVKATLEPKVINVTLEGKLDSISPEKIKAYVDLQGLEKGQHQVNVQVAPMEGLSLVNLEPGTVTVTLQ